MKGKITARSHTDSYIYTIQSCYSILVGKILVPICHPVEQTEPEHWIIWVGDDAVNVTHEQWDSLKVGDDFDSEKYQ